MSSINRFQTLPTIFLAVATVASCGGDSSSSQPSADEYNDVAQAIGSTTAPGDGGGEVGSFSDSAMLATGAMPAGLTLDVSGQIKGEHGGLEYEYALTCKSVAGATLPACAAATTDTATVDLSWSGSLDLPNISASVSRTGDWTLSGIQSGTPTFNGEGTFTFDIAVQSTFRTASASYHLDYDATYAAVVLNAAHKPISGSIHYAIAAQHMVSGTGGTANGSFDINAVVTFAADGTASLVLDGSHQYHLDLATGVVTLR